MFPMEWIDLSSTYAHLGIVSTQKAKSPQLSFDDIMRRALTIKTDKPKKAARPKTKKPSK